jgi:hypothetical protein
LLALLSHLKQQDLLKTRAVPDIKHFAQSMYKVTPSGPANDNSRQLSGVSTVTHLAVLEHCVHPLGCWQLLLARLVEGHQVREQLVPGNNMTAMQQQEQQQVFGQVK